jgi:hypothetical protein
MADHSEAGFELCFSVSKTGVYDVCHFPDSRITPSLFSMLIAVWKGSEIS